MHTYLDTGYIISVLSTCELTAKKPGSAMRPTLILNMGLLYLYIIGATYLQTSCCTRALKSPVN